MLVLTRKEREGTVIVLNGVPILRVVINEIRGHQIRLGFELPDELLVLRDEHFQEPQQVPKSINLKIEEKAG